MSDSLAADLVNLAQDFADRDAVLLTGSTDNEFCKVAWQTAHEDLKKITHHQFADTQRGELSLIELGRVLCSSRCGITCYIHR